MNIINLTKHDVNIYDEESNQVVVIKSSGKEARIETSVDYTGNLPGTDIPLFKTTVTGNPYLIDSNS